MPKEQVRTNRAPAAKGPYSQGIRTGDFIYVSGQGPLDPGTGQVVGTTIQEQTAQVLENIRAILDAAGASMADVVKATCHLADLSYFDGFNEVYERHFPEPRPARTTVGSQLQGILVEMDVIAHLSGR
ncbi:RidA family protein [Limnochorda pilosa]|uniref:Endoribonuclease L-PSP n=1 Tax=Limnochorda pilosa TaxID=1555112 RepID=A0A0K2SL77_LIMPI|nr:Rid family detoxifying hydrolase [Limnochorda pilosa]BAS27855.1 endoribonuclease L-PSP [Limnochorda pilosa]